MTAHVGSEQPPSAVEQLVNDVPGLDALGPTVECFDEWADGQLERLRGHAAADCVFSTASALGDFSAIWHFANLARATTSPGRRRQVPVLAVLIAAESLIVNQGIKRLFNRTRPTESGDHRYVLRRPATSSFPSGHASAAAFVATVLTEWDGKRSLPVWWSLAGIVATSRAYVRIHHASDVVAGFAVGAILGRFARRVARWFPGC